MCGFIGILQGRFSGLHQYLLDSALDALHHRGPDETRTWFDPQGRVAFGFTRLALVGLDNGSQPFVAPEGDIVMMVNGEFYDYRRIRSDLISKGCRFSTSSDSEIFLHLYRTRGLGGLQALRGEFSILLYDRKRNILVAIRDRLGVKPLYYAQHNGGWYFSSEIKGLLAAGVPAIWDEESYAGRGFILDNRSLFRGVHSISPGHWLIVEGGEARSGRYWDFNFAEQDASVSAIDEKSAIDAVRLAVEEAVRLRLDADVDIGVCLSGGIDSSSILGIASQQTGRRLNAYHLSFSGMGQYDEIEFAKIAAVHNDARLHVVPVSHDSIADHFEETIWHDEMPFFNAHSIAKLILCKFIGRSGTRGVLTGEGADEVFAGYPHFRRDMALYDNEGQDHHTVERLLHQIRTAKREPSSSETNRAVEWISAALGHGVSWLEAQAALVDPIAQVYSDDFSKRAENAEGYCRFVDQVDPLQMARRSPVHRSIYLLAKSCLPNIVLSTLGDRMEMAGSIEGRPPFLDHHVVDLACQLPAHLKVKGQTEKYVLREAMRPYLPDSLYCRKKQYFRAPPIAADRNSKLYQLIQDELSGGNIDKIPFFNAEKVRALSSNLCTLTQEEQIKLDYVLMEITGLCLMQRRFSLCAS